MTFNDNINWGNEGYEMDHSHSFEPSYPEYQPRSEIRKKKKKIKFTKAIVVTLIIAIIAYVAAVFWFVWHGKYPPDSLTYTFLPAIIGQLGIMGAIERKKKDVEIKKLHMQQNENYKGGIL